MFVPAEGGPMMQGDRFDHGIRQAPEGQEVGADFGMGRAEDILLGLPEGNFLLARHGERGLELIGQAVGDDQFAGVVEQAGHKALVGGFGIEVLRHGNSFGQDAGDPAMVPQVFKGELLDGGALEQAKNLDG